MSYLLDTHVVLWAARDDEQLPGSVRALLTDPATDVYVSSVTIWEVAIKSALGRPDFAVNARRLRRGLRIAGYKELTITGEHAAAVAELPPVHRDPFDRMLVAQSTVEGWSLITADKELKAYGSTVQLV